MLTTSERGRTMVSGYLRPDQGAEHALDAVVVEAPRFTARIDSCPLGATTVAVVEDPNSSTVTAYRPHPERSPRTHLVGVVTEGSGSLSNDTGSVRLRPGTMTIYSGSAPFVLRFDGAHRYVVTEIADSMAGPGIEDIDLAAPAGIAATGIAVQLLTGVTRADRLAAPTRSALGDSLLALLRETFDDICGNRAPRSLQDDIADWVERHLADEDLSPGRIAGAHFISVRYLHRLFQESGTTVGELVRRRRIERIKADLLAPASIALPVASVGARWGFADPNLLNRHFRAQEGVTPARWRREMSAAG